MKNNLLTISLLILLLFFLNGCENVFTRKHIREGVASFNIFYETKKEENPIVILLPHKMNTYFKDNSTASIVEGYFGAFRMIMLTRPDLDRKYTIVRILDKKYIYETTLNGTPFSATDMSNLKIKYLDTTVTYKGYNCKIAAVQCPSIQKDTFWVYYTTELGIKYANANSPYYEIPGVLLKFKLKMLNVIMDVSFEKIEPRKIDPQILEIPKEGYKYVSLDELVKIINSLQ